MRVPEFFMIEVTALGFWFPRASAAALSVVSWWACSSIMFWVTRARRSLLAIRPVSSTPT